MCPSIEELQNKKAELQNELQSLDEKEKSLDEKVRTLEEKVAIHELEGKIKAKHDTIDQFEARIHDLEGKLNEPAWEKEAPSEVQEPQTEQHAENLDAEEETEQEEFVVMEPSAPEETDSKPDQHETRKKRKFF